MESRRRKRGKRKNIEAIKGEVVMDLEAISLAERRSIGGGGRGWESRLGLMKAGRNE